MVEADTKKIESARKITFTKKRDDAGADVKNAVLSESDQSIPSEKSDNEAVGSENKIDQSRGNRFKLGALGGCVSSYNPSHGRNNNIDTMTNLSLGTVIIETEEANVSDVEGVSSKIPTSFNMAG